VHARVSGPRTHHHAAISARKDAAITAKEDSVEGYCVKCKAKKEVKAAKQIETKNGRPAVQGTCPVCGTKITVIGAKLK
jgi:hypothetical protein